MQKDPIEARDEALKRRRQFIEIFGGPPTSAEANATIDVIAKNPLPAIEQLREKNQITQQDAVLLTRLANSDDPQEKTKFIRRVVREPDGHSTTIISVSTLLAGDEEEDDVVTAMALDPLSVAVGFVLGFAAGVLLVTAVVVYTIVTCGTGSGSSGSGSGDTPEENPEENPSERG